MHVAASTMGKVVVLLILVIFWLSLAANLIFVLQTFGMWSVPAMIVGWFFADMASGIIHMTMDYWPCRPGIGFDKLYFFSGDRSSQEYQAIRTRVMAQAGPFQRLVYDFKNHHPRPEALGRRSIQVQIGSTVALLTLPVSIALNLWCVLDNPPDWLVAGLVTFIIGGTLAQYFHGTLHRNDNPWIISTMRRCRLLMTPDAHQKHHDSLRRDFATNNGWSNIILNPVFRFMYDRRWFTDAGLEPTR